MHLALQILAGWMLLLNTVAWGAGMVTDTPAVVYTTGWIGNALLATSTAAALLVTFGVA